VHPAELARMYTLGLDTIAGAKILQVKFGTAGAFQPGQTVLHKERRARIIRISADTAAIRYWGESDEVAVPPEALSPPLNTLARLCVTGIQGNRVETSPQVARLAFAGRPRRGGSRVTASPLIGLVTLEAGPPTSVRYQPDAVVIPRRSRPERRSVPERRSERGGFRLPSERRS